MKQTENDLGREPIGRLAPIDLLETSLDFFRKMCIISC